MEQHADTFPACLVDTRIVGIIICVHIHVKHHMRERRKSSFLVDKVIENEPTNCN